MPKQIDIYVPCQYNDGESVPLTVLRSEERWLVSMFGGVTILAGCTGLWRSPTGQTQRESVEIWRVIVGVYDAQWWRDYRKRARLMYGQEDVLIVVSDCERIG